MYVCGKCLGGGIVRNIAGSGETGSGRRVTQISFDALLSSRRRILPTGLFFAWPGVGVLFFYTDLPHDSDLDGFLKNVCGPNIEKWYRKKSDEGKSATGTISLRSSWYKKKTFDRQ